MEKQKCPEVRFIGFVGGWFKSSLAKCTDLLTGNPFDSNEFTSSGVLLVRGMNVKRGYLDTSANLSKYWPSSKGLERYLLQAEDIVIQMDGALIGKSYAKINSKDLPALLVQRVARVRSNKVESEFIYQYIHKGFLSHISGIKTETAVPHLSLNDIRNFTFFLPDQSEQIIIGDLFRKLDQSIALHEKKLAQTQNFKKAMLGKMFPKQGTQRPEIRLKGFGGDWHSSKLLDYISIKHGYAFNGEFFSDKETDYCLLTPGNFRIGGGFKAEKFIYYKGEVPKNYILKENDLIVTMTDLSKESDTLGLPALLPSIKGKTFLHNQRLGLINFENSELDKEFLFYLLQTKSYHKYIVLAATGTTVKHTSPSKILGFTCKIPEPAEQEKIGQFFKKIDEKIYLHQQQLQTVKNLKQAFLEKMFV
ncbi:restriction endonuclease subunit S [Acinetobacter sp. YH16057]|uniref:restriction endonuclease subunit S n=1 Tax=Acinetobacter sp. YH16057 TaxID=2601195 RepID=UPI0015D40BC4